MMYQKIAHLTLMVMMNDMLTSIIFVASKMCGSSLLTVSHYILVVWQDIHGHATTSS